MNNFLFLEENNIKIEDIPYVTQGEKRTHWKYHAYKNSFTTQNYMLTYIKKGGIRSITPERERIFSEGTLYLLKAPEFNYTNYSIKQHTITYNIVFRSIEPLPFDFPGDGRISVHPEFIAETEMQFKKALEVFIEKPIGWQLKLRSILYNVLFDFVNLLYKKEQKKRVPRFLRKSIEIINEKAFSETINITNLAESENISVAHFNRVLKNEFGMPPKKYINMIKIKRAASLLENTDNSINEVCEIAGFNDISYFNRTFKAETGMSPGEYKRKNRTENTHI